MITRKIFTATIACTLLAGGMFVAGPTANAAQPASTVISVSSTNTACKNIARVSFNPKIFSSRCVTARVPTQIVFNSAGSKFIVIATKQEKIVMRGNKQGIQAFLKGAWVAVPYTIDRASRTANLDYKKVNKGNFLEDPISGSTVVKSTPTAKPIPGSHPGPRPAPVSTPDVDIRPWMTENGRDQSPDTNVINTLGSGWRAEMLAQINAVRNAEGIPSLTTCKAVNSAGQWKANDMAMATGMTHNSTMGYGAPDYYYGNLGYRFGSSGENVAYGQRSVSEAVSSWLNSPIHRTRIMDPKFTLLGMGAQTGQGKIYLSQQFFEGQTPCVG